jgi:hypothetical protein
LGDVVGFLGRQQVVLKHRRQAGQNWVPAFAGMSGKKKPMIILRVIATILSGPLLLIGII